jgi:acyl carrier protein
MNMLNEQLIALFSEVSGKPVTLNTKISTLNLDSLDTLEVSMKMKNELNINLNVDAFVSMDTIEDLVSYVENLKL